MLCDNCSRLSTRIFERIVNGKSVFLCHRCIDVQREILEILKMEGCLNTMEICRRLNGIGLWTGFQDAKEHPEECVKGQKFGEKRKWGETNCRAKENGCVFHYCDVYRYLKRLEKKGIIHSIKTRFWDRTPLRTDTFRFWFINCEAYHNRVEKQKLTAYLPRDKS